MNKKPNRLQKYQYDVIILMISLLILGLARSFYLEDEERIFISKSIRFPLPTTCLIKTIFSIDCPTCGITRSVIAWLHGNFADAWRLHRVSIFVVIFIIVQIPYRIWIISTGKRVQLFSMPVFILFSGGIFPGLLIINWILNLIKGNFTP